MPIFPSVVRPDFSVRTYCLARFLDMADTSGTKNSINFIDFRFLDHQSQNKIYEIFHILFAE